MASVVEVAPLIRNAIVRHGTAALSEPLKKVLCASAPTSAWVLLAALSGAAQRAGITNLSPVQAFGLPGDLSGATELLAEIATAVCDAMCAQYKRVVSEAHRQFMLPAACASLVVLRLNLQPLYSYIQSAFLSSSSKDLKELMKMVPELHACLKTLAKAGFDVTIAATHNHISATRIDMIAALSAEMLDKLSLPTFNLLPDAAELQVVLGTDS